MTKIAAIAAIAVSLAALAAAGAAGAQTYNPAQSQARTNQFQLQLQAGQLQQLQQQNTLGLQQPDPGAQTQALIRQQQIREQIEANTTLQEQQRSPQTNPTDTAARLQQSGAAIDQLQQQQPLPR